MTTRVSDPDHAKTYRSKKSVDLHVVQIKAAGSPLSKASSLADGADEGFNASSARKYTPLSVDLTSPSQTTVQAASGDLNPAVSVPSVVRSTSGPLLFFKH